MIIRKLVFLFCVCNAIGCNQETTPQQFVDDDLVIPGNLKTDEFILLPIKEAYAELDFQAVKASAVALQSKFGGDWPTEDFSLEQNLEEIVIHVEQFEKRSAFTYSVFSPDRGRILGCVYIVPDELNPQNAKIIFWLRTDEKTERLEPALKTALDVWLSSEWAFPGYSF